jgi:hypothetical protein
MSLSKQFGTKSVVASAVFALSSLFCAEASADYLCSVLYRPIPGAFGSEGVTNFSTYSEPGCQGTFLNSGLLCSTGATSHLCPSAAGARYERHGMLAMFGAMQRAANMNQWVTPFITTCNDGTPECFLSFYFQSL